MAAGESAGEGDIRHYLRVLRRRKWTVVFATVVVLATALVFSFLQRPRYAARAEILLRPPASEVSTDGNQNRDATRSIPTEIQLMQSDAVRNRVRGAIGAAPAVQVNQVRQTEFIAVRAEHRDPEQAAIIANTYAEEFIEYRRDQVVESLDAVSERLQNRRAEKQAQIDALAVTLADVRPGQPLTAAQQQAVAQRDVLVREQAAIDQNLSEIRTSAETAAGSAQLITPASVPTEPFSPNHLRTGVLALIIGLCFGLGLGFLVDMLDDTIKSKEEVERQSNGLPVLGIIPFVAAWRDRDRPFLVSLAQPGAVASEAYRTVRTAIQFLGLDRPTRTIQVTSPSAREGKTTTLTNLGVALANAGQRVVLVDCDLRRPRVHEFFGCRNNVGFTSVLLGDAPLSEALQRPIGDLTLWMLPSGPPPPNPSELLSGRRTVDVLTMLQGEFDVVLIDCPPVLPVTDAAALANRVDATLVVVTAGTTTRKSLHRAVELLGQVNAPLIGTVLNSARGESAFGYGYGYGGAYGYGYGGDPEPATGRRRRRSRRESVHSNV